MSKRLDVVVHKFPAHEDGIRLLASRDPSGNLKYLDWGGKILSSGQALAPEIADIIEMFHQFSGRAFRDGRRKQRIRPDIYSYSPLDLASLRDGLLKIKRASDRKRREREKLYKLEGEIEADTVYDSVDFVVRHIKNKAASCHYGLGTKWCIAMNRAGYFEDYESQNATFFFWERKSPKGDQYDKVALMVPRQGGDQRVEAFTSLDQQVDMLSLARIYGALVFDIFREIWLRSETYPGSTMVQVYSGKASDQQLMTTFSSVAKKPGVSPYELSAILEAVCCNDAAPWSLLEEVLGSANKLMAASWRSWLRRRDRDRRRRRPLLTRERTRSAELTRKLLSAAVIHPHTPSDVRERLTKELRKRRIRVENIHIEHEHDGPISVCYRSVRYDRYGRRRGGFRAAFRRRSLKPSWLRQQIARHERDAVRLRKKVEKLEHKQKESEKKKAARMKKKTKTYAAKGRRRA